MKEENMMEEENMIKVIDCIGCNKKLRVRLDRGTLILTCPACSSKMDFIVVEKLNGVDNSAKPILFEAMRTCSNEDRLTVVLYMMSDILKSKEKYDLLSPEDQRFYRDNNPDYLDKIELNLKKIFPPNLKNNKSPNDYTDFQASAIRSIFNFEKKNFDAEQSDERLWENLQPYTGLWRNTDYGNRYAAEILRERRVIVSYRNKIEYQQEEAQRQRQQEEAQREHTSSSIEDDWYVVLGIPSSSNSEQIKAAYRKRMGEYHPDRIPNAGEKLQELAKIESQKITAAYRDAKSRGLVD